MRFDPDRVRENARTADTEDLLDRITVYREGMETEALEIIEQELNRRRVPRQQIDSHAARREEEAIFLPDGTAASCTFCHAPAVAQGWDWHRFRYFLLPWLAVPLFPRFHYYCREHCPARLMPAPSSHLPE